MKKKVQRSVPPKKRILIVDDHPIVREGLALLINRENDIEVCGMADDSSKVEGAIRETSPDLVLMDVTIHGLNGIDVTRDIRKNHPDLVVLILSMHDESLYAVRALKAGASGYLMKHEAPEVVLRAIREALAKGVYVSDRMRSTLLSDRNSKSKENHRIGVDRLSNRQLQVFQMIGRGMVSRDIARQLRVSQKTVEAHRAQIRSKLGLKSSAELTHRAICWVEVKRET